MNELTFVIALLHEKGILTKSEAVALRKVAVEQTLSNDLSAMHKKIVKALNIKDDAIKVQNINAKDLL